MLQHIKKLIKWSTLGRSSGDPGLRYLTASIGQYASSGELITADTVLSNPAVLNGVRAIATTCATIPFDVYRRSSDGSRKKADNHPAQSLLWRPNRYSTKSTLLTSWVANAIVWGNGYLYITRDELGRPQQLDLLDPGAVAIIIEQDQMYYTTSKDGRYYKIDPDDMCHLRGIGTDGVTGLPLYSLLADTFGLGITLQRYTNLYFKNGNKPSVVISLPPECAAPEKIKEFREAWGEVHSGLNNAFKPALVRPGSTIQVLPNNNDSAQLNELRETDIVAVANALGLPSNVINGRLSSVAYGSVQAEKLSFLEKIDIWTTSIEEELSLKLLRTSEVNSHYIEGNRKALIKITPEVEADLLIKYRSAGLLSDEECRQRLNMPTEMEGSFWVATSLIPREIALKGPQPPAAPQTPSDEEPEDSQGDSPQEATQAKPEAEVRQSMDYAKDAALRQLTANSVERLIRRAAKSGKLEPELWHEEFASLPGVHKLSLPVEELAHVLPEQREQVLEKINIADMVNTLWTQ